MRFNIFIWRILDLKDLVLKLVLKEWFNTSHGLDNVGNSNAFESIKILSTSDVSNVEMGNDLIDIWGHV